MFGVSVATKTAYSFRDSHVSRTQAISVQKHHDIKLPALQFTFKGQMQIARAKDPAPPAELQNGAGKDVLFFYFSFFFRNVFFFCVTILLNNLRYIHYKHLFKFT